MDELLFCACNSEEPRVERVSQLLEQGAQPAAHVNEDGWTSLIAAARWGHTGIVQLLVEKYVATETALTRFVNAIDGDRNTALMHAAKHGHLPTLRLLLEAKSTHFTAVRVVELDAQNKDGWTATMLAVREGYVDVVQTLVETGANADIVSVEGITATDIAFVAKNSPMMLVLPPGSKGKGDSMQAQATVRSGGNAFPIHFSYRSEPMAAIGDGGAKSIAGQSVEQGSKVEQNEQAGVKKSCCTIL